MKNSTARRIGVTIVALGALGVAFCTHALRKAPHGESPIAQATLRPMALRHSPNTLWMAAADEPQSIDPALANDSVGTEVIANLFAGLVDLDPDTLAPRPDLAAHWEVSADGRTYTFFLRSNVWSDGTPLTADAFVYALRRALNPATGCRTASMLYLIEGAEAVHRGAPAHTLGVQALNPHTLTITLKAPTPYFLHFLAYNLFRPVPAHVLDRLARQGLPPEAWTQPAHLVTSGAYTVAQWRFKRDYTLRKNPRYWGANRVAIDEVVVRMVPSVGTTVNLYQAGELDWTGTSNALPSSYVATLRAYPDFYSEPLLSTYFYWLNTKRGPLRDVRVRKALALSIDREALTHYVLRGGQRPSADLVPEGMVHYPPVQAPSLDVAQARALLKQAGYDAKHPMPPLTLIYNTAESHRQIAEAVQAMWQSNLGIAVRLENQEWRVFLDHIATGDFDIARMGWTGDYPDANSFLTDVLGTATGNNMSGWQDAAYERLLDQAAHTQDVPARQALLHTAEAQALAAQPLVPLFFSTLSGLRHPHLQGMGRNVLGHHPIKNMAFAEQAPR